MAENVPSIGKGITNDTDWFHMSAIPADPPEIDKGITSKEIPDSKIGVGKDQKQSVYRKPDLKNYLMEIWTLANPPETNPNDAQEWSDGMEQFIQAITSRFDVHQFLGDETPASDDSLSDAENLPEDDLRPREPRSVAKDRQDSPTSRTSSPGQGFLGTPEEVMLRVGMAISQMKGNWSQMVNLLQGPIADTLDRWERDDVGSTERRLDLVLVTLVQFRAPFDEPLVVKILSGLRTWLMKVPASEWDAGLLSTWGSFGDVFSRSESAVMEGGYYYHELLSGMVKSEDARTRIPGLKLEDGWCRHAIHVQLNNLCGRLATVARGKDSLLEEDTLAMLNTLHSTSVVLATRRSIANIESLSQVMQTLFGTDNPGGEVAETVSRMLNNSAAWLNCSGRLSGCVSQSKHDRLGFLSILSGLVRPALVNVDDYDDITASFFNASINYSRIGNASEIEWMQATVAGIGFWWALELGGDNLEYALQQLNGLDCAVNCLGSLAALEAEAPVNDPALSLMVTVLVRHEEAMGRQDLDLLRLGRAAERLRLNLSSKANEKDLPQSSEDLRNMADRVMESVCRCAPASTSGDAIQWPTLSSDKRVAEKTLELATFLRTVLERYHTARKKTGGPSLEETLTETRTLLTAIQGLQKEATEKGALALLDSVYQKYAGNPWSEPPEPGKGPFAGLVSEDEWAKVARRCVAETAPASMAQWIRDCCKRSGVK
ncbi:MAG: hypothetical protein HQL76_08465 [Magnetococcales bacterium]|nr:hypothetical protein [Magnetococcales bacterium]